MITAVYKEDVVMEDADMKEDGDMATENFD